jgi:hypothetical protein
MDAEDFVWIMFAKHVGGVCKDCGRSELRIWEKGYTFYQYKFYPICFETDVTRSPKRQIKLIHATLVANPTTCHLNNAHIGSPKTYVLIRDNMDYIVGVIRHYFTYSLFVF